jgi:aarF domain-containing kinase
MSALHTLSPLLRRGMIPSWTCRACSRSQGQAILRSNAFTSRIPGKTGYATRVKSVDGLGATGNATKANSSPTANAIATDSTIAGGHGRPNGNNGHKSRRRRRLIIAGGGALTLGAAAITFNDDAQHAYTAAQRSYRVAETLALNIKEYVVKSWTSEEPTANLPRTATAPSSSSTPTQTIPPSSKNATSDAQSERSAPSRKTAPSS